MAYSDFSIESALAPRTASKHIKLEGVGNAVAVLRSRSTSTEEFMQGAISALGNADRQIMFVNSSIEALNDRLKFATSLAKAINTSKAHGVEGFANTPRLDPWAYALEDSDSKNGFFAKLWAAIKTACRRVYDAIANFIKWLGNAIASASVRGQAKDYKFYTANKGAIERNSKAQKVDAQQFNSLQWSITADGLAKMITKASGEYAKGIAKKGEDIKVMENVSRKSFSVMQNAKDYKKAYGDLFSKWFGLSGNTAESAFKNASDKVKKMTAEMNDQLKGEIGSIFGKSSSDKVSAHSLVMNAVCGNDGKVGPMTVGKMKQLSGNFAVLSEDWLAKNVKQAVSSVHAQQKQFTEYTKNVDKVASQFTKDNGTKDNPMKAMSSLLTELARTRIRYNSFWTGLMLEFESVALRYRKSAHIALKYYIRTAQKGTNDAKKAAESLSDQSIEALFNFD